MKPLSSFDIPRVIAAELSLKPEHVQNALERVLEVNEPLKRISLSMRAPSHPRPACPQKQSTIEDLKAKFNRRR